MALIPTSKTVKEVLNVTPILQQHFGNSSNIQIKNQKKQSSRSTYTLSAAGFLLGVVMSRKYLSNKYVLKRME